MTAVADVIPAQTPAQTRRIAWEKAWWVPLAVILAAQAVLSGQAVHSVITFDEARYIYAGHSLIYELLHGGGSPYYENYFSGAPDIYCPIAAVADHFGGIVAVRLMCLCFSLTSTALLFAVTRHLFSYWAGIAAAALFAGLGLTHFVGTYANYDSMALMFLCCAAYCAVRSRGGRWFLLIPVALLAANATKYATLVFDPVVIALAALQVQGWHRMAMRVAALGVATATLLGLVAYLAGTSYIRGILFTTLARKPGANVILGATYKTTPQIITESWSWIGITVALGAMSLLMAVLFSQDKRRLALLGLAVVAGSLVTVEAVHLHSNESMNQHDDFSAWFACIAAGYGLSVVPRLTDFRVLRYATIAVAAALVLATGVHYAPVTRVFTLTQEGKTNLAVYAKFKPYLAPRGQRFLLGGNSEFQLLYTIGVTHPWFDFSDDSYIKYPIPGRGGDPRGQAPGLACLSLKPGCMYLEGPAGYRAAIRAHYFALISMVGEHWTSHGTVTLQDLVIAQTAEHTPGYVLVMRWHNEPTWILASAYERHGPGGERK